MRIAKKIVVMLVGVLLFGTGTLAAKEQTTTIKIQSGEKWWGLVVDPKTVHLPFENAFELSTADFSPEYYAANMMLSNRGRYVWSSTPFTASYDGKQIVLTPAKGEKAPTVEKSGRTLREAYLMCCHKNFPPQHIGSSVALFESPIYEFGGGNSLLYTSKDVLAFADMLVGRGAPKGTILLPQGWRSPSGAMVFDMEAYPDAKEMIEHLHSEGMKVMLTVTPYVMAAGRGYQQHRLDGTLLTDSENRVIVFESRLGYTACRALTPEGVKRSNSDLRALQKEYGVDGFYFDCLDAMDLLADNPQRLREFLDAWHTISEGIDVAIYSSPMGQQLGSIASSVSTTRNYNWESLEESLERAIDASVLGFSRTTLAADLNFAKQDPELILRTASLAALLPVAIIPYSVWSLEDTTPFCSLLKWRSQQGSYYLSLAEQGASSAEPILRHLEYQFPRTGFTNARDEFMIGSKWLVAPVVNSGGVRMVRLPKGKWRDVWSQRSIKGPRVIDVDVSDGNTPIYEKVEN